jgi:hypothetical protein
VTSTVFILFGIVIISPKMRLNNDQPRVFSRRIRRLQSFKQSRNVFKESNRTNRFAITDYLDVKRRRDAPHKGRDLVGNPPPGQRPDSARKASHCANTIKNL